MQPEIPAESLGEFLRARRERLRPDDFGLPGGQRRRTPGLRREEVAQLCGISPTWIAWIEQGRTGSVSVATLAALARGLRLSRAERRYLFELAARRDPLPPRGAGVDVDEIRPLVEAVATPAYVLDRHWAPLAWNRAASRLFSTWLGRTTKGTPPGLLDYVFLDPAARRFIVGWSARARRLVAEYRADTAAWHDDPVRRALVAHLSESSPDFRAAWNEGEVLGREGGLRSFQTRDGRRTFRQYTLRPAQWPDLKLVVLTPAAVRA